MGKRIVGEDEEGQACGSPCQSPRAYCLIHLPLKAEAVEDNHHRFRRLKLSLPICGTIAQGQLGRQVYRGGIGAVTEKPAPVTTNEKGVQCYCWAAATNSVGVTWL